MTGPTNVTFRCHTHGSVKLGAGAVTVVESPTESGYLVTAHCPDGCLLEVVVSFDTALAVLDGGSIFAVPETGP